MEPTLPTHVIMQKVEPKRRRVVSCDFIKFSRRVNLAQRVKKLLRILTSTNCFHCDSSSSKVHNSFISYLDNSKASRSSVTSFNKPTNSREVADKWGPHLLFDEKIALCRLVVVLTIKKGKLSSNSLMSTEVKLIVATVSLVDVNPLIRACLAPPNQLVLRLVVAKQRERKSSKRGSEISISKFAKSQTIRNGSHRLSKWNSSSLELWPNNTALVLGYLSYQKR